MLALFESTGRSVRRTSSVTTSASSFHGLVGGTKLAVHFGLVPRAVTSGDDTNHPRVGDVLVSAVTNRRWDELATLVSRACEAALADPDRTRADLGDVSTAIDQTISTLDLSVPPRAILALVDALNVLACIGAPLGQAREDTARSWLTGIADAFAPRSAEQIRIGLAAVALGELDIARGIAGRCVDTRESWPSLAEGPHTLVDHAIVAVGKRAPSAIRLASVHAALGAGCEATTVLWCARLAYHDPGTIALRDVVGELHELIAMRSRRHGLAG